MFNMRENTGRIAASVFPLPVGAIMSTLLPAKISGIANFCGSVGSVIPLSLRASTIDGWSKLKTTQNKTFIKLFTRGHVTTRAVFLLLILTAFAYAATLVVNGTVKYTAFVKNNTVIIENDTVEIPPVRYTWDYNNTYTVFGIYYANSVCTISYWPNAPRFYIQCPVGTDFVIVAVKDPKAKVTCRVRNTPLQPRNQHDYVLIFQTRDLGVECESGYPRMCQYLALYLESWRGSPQQPPRY